MRQPDSLTTFGVQHSTQNYRLASDNFSDLFCCTGGPLMRVQRVSLVLFSVMAFLSQSTVTESHGPTSLTWSDFINRLNFGLAAFKIQRACITEGHWYHTCLLYTSPSPRDGLLSR